MKKVGDEVQLCIGHVGTPGAICRTAKISEIREDGGIELSWGSIKNAGRMDLSQGDVEAMGIKVEQPKKTMWVSNGDPSVAIRAEPPVCNIGEWTKYEEVRD